MANTNFDDALVIYTAENATVEDTSENGDKWLVHLDEPTRETVPVFSHDGITVNIK